MTTIKIRILSPIMPNCLKMGSSFCICPQSQCLEWPKIAFLHSWKVFVKESNVFKIDSHMIPSHITLLKMATKIRITPRAM